MTTKTLVNYTNLPQDNKSVWQGCDGCSARAQFQVDFPFGTLMFCNHHMTKHLAKIKELFSDLGITTEEVSRLIKQVGNA